MPRQTPSVCAEPGCPAVADRERCPDHERQRQRQADAQRSPGSRTLQTGDKRWRTIRARVLAAEPSCRDCGREAQHVDHVNGDARDNRPANLQPLCGPCHSRKTSTADQQRDEQGRWTRSDEQASKPKPKGSAGSVPLG